MAGVEEIMPIIQALIERGQRFLSLTSGMKSQQRAYEILGEFVLGTPISTVAEIVKLAGARKFSTSVAFRPIRMEDVAEGGARISPFLYLDGDWTNGARVPLRLQLVLVMHESPLSELTGAIGIRFECPESGDVKGRGKHDFFHSQMFSQLYIGGPDRKHDLPNCPLWLPSSTPSWVLGASSPRELLAAMVVALYGKVIGPDVIFNAYPASMKKTQAFAILQAIGVHLPS